MTPPAFAVVLSASLLGSLHCGAMCGPFVAAYAGNLSFHEKKSWWAHLSYHLGRLGTYATLGGVAGGLGSVVDFAFDQAGWLDSAAWLASCALILAGAVSLWPKSKAPGPQVLGRHMRPLLRLGTKPRTVRAPLLGLITPLLPCGWLYAFVLMAGGTGSAVSGALLMATFWLGTVPALLGLGLALAHLGTHLRARLPVVMGVLWIGIGLWGVFARTSDAAWLGPMATAAPGNAAALHPSCHGAPP